MSEFTNSDYDVIGLDWTMNVHDCRITAPGQTLMGNMDPCALYGGEVRNKSYLLALFRANHISKIS